MVPSETRYPMPPAWVLDALQEGLVIPAHPLALTEAGALDERSQRALSRYYHAAGAGGIAVGVHTTQFAIREAGLFKPVLSLAHETIVAADTSTGRKTVMIAGITGKTAQAVAEAEIARASGYHIGLLSLAALKNASVDALMDHVHAVAGVMPLMGFYLQPAVGGRLLPRSFWRRFASVPNVVAIKIAPFDRYKTQDVIHGVAEATRDTPLALYTGNDDHILLDLVTPFPAQGRDWRMAGGLLGHWACWTSRAVECLAEAKQLIAEDAIPSAYFKKAEHVTEMNAALFDAANGFSGCIAGIQHVLHLQGLIDSPRCLDANERLSPGQAEAIANVVHKFPELVDDAFVAEHRDAWRR